MSKKLVFITCTLLLLTGVSVLAQKGPDGANALSTLCDLCSYTLANGDSYPYGRSVHSFRINSNGKAVNQIEVTLKIHTTGPVSYEIRPLYTGYDHVDSTSYRDGSAFWLNLIWNGVNNKVFNNEALFELVVSSTECVSIGGQTLIEVTDYPDKSFYNFFFVNGEPNNAYTPIKNDGYRTMYDPEAVVSVIGTADNPPLPPSCAGQKPGDANSDGIIDLSDVTFLIALFTGRGTAPNPLQNGDPNGDCLVTQADLQYIIDYIYMSGPAPVNCSCEEIAQIADSAVVGDTVSVPIFLRSINFDYRSGYHVTLNHDSALIPVAIDTTYLSGSPWVNPGPTSDEYMHNGNNINHDSAASLPALFLTARFVIDSTVAQPGQFLSLSIGGDYIFAGCPNYQDTGNGDIANVWIKTLWDNTRCYNCNYALGSDTVIYDIDVTGRKESIQEFTFDSDNQQVEKIEVTLKVNTTGAIGYDIIDRGYGQPLKESFSDGSAFWIHLTWPSVGNVAFDNTPVFDLKLLTAECQAPWDSMAVELVGNSGHGWMNRYKQTGNPAWQTLGSLGTGYVIMTDPIVVASVLGYREPLVPQTSCPGQKPGDFNGDGIFDISDVSAFIAFLAVRRYDIPPEPFQNGDPNGDCLVDTNDTRYLINYIYMGGPAPVDCSCAEMPQIVDSNNVKKEVRVPIFLRDINFDYGPVSAITLFHDKALVFAGSDSTDYSKGFHPWETSDTTILYYNNSTEISKPVDLPALFLTTRFAIDSTQTVAGAVLPVNIFGDYRFQACPTYVGTGNGDIAKAWVKVSHDSTICYDCVTALSDDSIFYDVNAGGLKTSHHLFTFDSHGQQVETIDITLKVVTPGQVDCDIIDRGFGLPTKTTFTDGSNHWINLVWPNAGNIVYSNATLFELALKASECQPPGDSLLVEVANNVSRGYFNRFKETGHTYYQSTINFDRAYVIMREPLAHISLWDTDDAGSPPPTCTGQKPGDFNGDGIFDISDVSAFIAFLAVRRYDIPPEPFQNGDPNGDCLVDTNDTRYLINYIYTGGPAPVDCSCPDMPQILDSNYVGQQVSVPVFFRAINFDYRQGFSFTIYFDRALAFAPFETTQYSTGTIRSAYTDTSATFHLGPNTLEKPDPSSLPTRLLTAKFTLNSSRTRAGVLYPVSVKGEYVFTGCPGYADTGTDNIPTTWVKARWDLNAYCPWCTLDATDNRVYYEVDANGLKESRHMVTLNTHGQQADEVEVTLKVNTAEVVQFSGLDRGFGVPVTSSHNAGPAYYMNFVLSGLHGQVFDGDTVFEVSLKTAQCLAPSDSLALEFADLPTSGFDNHFQETGTGYQKSVVKRFPGFAKLYAPTLDVSLLNTGQVPGQIVDSSYGAAPVKVPIYFKDMNYDYRNYAVRLSWDDRLKLNHIERTAFSPAADSMWFDGAGTDSLIIYKVNGWVQRPATFPGVFAYAWFNIDTARSAPGEDLRVDMYKAEFHACDDYGKLSDVVDEYVYVRHSDSNICINASYSLSIDSVQYSGGYAYTDFFSTFKFNSDAKPVNQIDVTFKVHSPDVYFVVIDSNYLTRYTNVTINHFPDSPYYWCNVRATGLDGTVFNDVPVFRFQIRTNECRPPHQQIPVEFASRVDSGWYNQFVTSSGAVKTLLEEDKHDGYLWFRDPHVELSLFPEPIPPTLVIDSSYVGGSVDLPVYLKLIDFDYASGFFFRVRFDSALAFSEVVQTPYSQGPRFLTHALGATDTSVILYFQGDWVSHPTVPWTVLLKVRLRFDPALAHPNTPYQVRLSGDYIFKGCQFIADTGNVGTEYGFLKTVKEVATLRYESISIAPNTPGARLYYSIKTTAPIATDIASDSLVFARWTFDSTALSYTHYAGMSTQYEYRPGDTLYWEHLTFNGDTMVIEENHILRSAMIDASYDWQRLGYLSINAGPNAGVDYVRFPAVTSPASPLFKKDNFVVFKYTNDTARYIDSVKSGVIYYGKLQLVPGTVTVTSGGGPVGCPMLYAWNGGSFVQEDFILTQSHGQTDPAPANDFYPLEAGVVDQDGYYRVQICEFENEFTSLDQAELIAVDYPATSNVGISNEGRVYTYSQAVTPVVAVDEAGQDVLPYVVASDELWYEATEAGSITLTYENPFYGKEGRGFALGFGDTGGELKKDPGGPAGTSTLERTENVKAVIEDAGGAWHDLGNVPPRQYLSDNCTFFVPENLAELGQTFRVKITWDRNFRTNVQQLQIDDGVQTEQHRVAPRSAAHSVLGTTTQKLALIDNDAVTLRPGENIEIRFVAPKTTVPDGYARKYFLKTNGYFRTLKSSDLLPREFVLYNNYPNPFNPITTIKFSVPYRSDISLVVYNVLGQEVRTLYSGTIEAGIHELPWNGDNSSGESVASGVYFYRLRAGSFDQARKMTLIK